MWRRRREELQWEALCQFGTSFDAFRRRNVRRQRIETFSCHSLAKEFALPARRGEIPTREWSEPVRQFESQRPFGDQPVECDPTQSDGDLISPFPQGLAGQISIGDLKQF